MFGIRKSGIEIASHYEAAKYLQQTDSSVEGEDVDLPYTGIHYFKTTETLIGPNNILKKGTVGAWRSFLPYMGVYLDDETRRDRSLYFVNIGLKDSEATLAFKGTIEDEIMIAGGGVYKYLQGNYSLEETKGILSIAQELYFTNQWYLEQGVDEIEEFVNNNC